MNNIKDISRYLWGLALILAMNTAWAGAAAELSEHPTILTISGQVQPPGLLHFSLPDLLALPHHELKTSTVVTDGVFRFQGVLMRDLLECVSAHGDVIEAEATNGYSTVIPWADTKQYDVLVAWAMDGEFLNPKDKGPLWVVYPRDDFPQLQDIRYDYRWVWQLNHLTVK